MTLYVVGIIKVRGKIISIVQPRQVSQRFDSGQENTITEITFKPVIWTYTVYINAVQYKEIYDLLYIYIAH